MFEYIYLKNWIHQDLEIASTIVKYCKHENIPFDDESLTYIKGGGKLLQNVLFSLNKLPIIPTMYISPNILKYKYEQIVSEFGSPFILKDSKSDKGRLNYLVKNRDRFLSILKYSPKSTSFICQPFINSYYEERYLIMSGDVVLMIHRSKYEVSKDHKINAKGMNEKIITDKKEWRFKEIAEKVSDIVKREILAVDILIDNNNNPYILEANASPGMNVKNKDSIIKVDKFQEYILKEIKSKRE